MTESGEAPGKLPESSLRRRSFLASAALGAAAPAAARRTGAAVPAAQVTAGTVNGRSVAGLLAVPGRDRGGVWLRAALQVAVELELSTIPPYLCAWWSVKDRGCEAARLVRRVVGDEMYHLGVVCNLLAAVGGRPRIAAAARSYPCPLPGGVRPGVTVHLSGLTRSLVRDVMMAIEEPEEPLARRAASPPTIGTFYGDLMTAFRSVAPALSPHGQLSARIGSDVLEPVRTPDDVERCLDTVKEQGEGTTRSPADAAGDDHPAHYYAFAEIYHGRRIVRWPDGWRFTGEPVPFPDVRPMAVVPEAGRPGAPARVVRLLDQADAVYHAVLDGLDQAWGEGGTRALDTAVRAMRALEAPAVELMEIPLPDAPGTYGPRFSPPSPATT